MSMRSTLSSSPNSNNSRERIAGSEELKTPTMPKEEKEIQEYRKLIALKENRERLEQDFKKIGRLAIQPFTFLIAEKLLEHSLILLNTIKYILSAGGTKKIGSADEIVNFYKAIQQEFYSKEKSLLKLSLENIYALNILAQLELEEMKEQRAADFIDSQRTFKTFLDIATNTNTELDKAFSSLQGLRQQVTELKSILHNNPKNKLLTSLFKKHKISYETWREKSLEANSKAQHGDNKTSDQPGKDDFSFKDYLIHMRHNDSEIQDYLTLPDALDDILIQRYKLKNSKKLQEFLENPTSKHIIDLDKDAENCRNMFRQIKDLNATILKIDKMRDGQHFPDSSDDHFPASLGNNPSSYLNYLMISLFPYRWNLLTKNDVICLKLEICNLIDSLIKMKIFVPENIKENIKNCLIALRSLDLNSENLCTQVHECLVFHHLDTLLKQQDFNFTDLQVIVEKQNKLTSVEAPLSEPCDQSVSPLSLSTTASLIIATSTSSPAPAKTLGPQPLAEETKHDHSKEKPATAPHPQPLTELIIPNKEINLVRSQLMFCSSASAEENKNNIGSPPALERKILAMIKNRSDGEAITEINRMKEKIGKHPNRIAREEYLIMLNRALNTEPRPSLKEKNDLATYLIEYAAKNKHPATYRERSFTTGLSTHSKESLPFYTAILLLFDNDHSKMKGIGLTNIELVTKATVEVERLASSAATAKAAPTSSSHRPSRA